MDDERHEEGVEDDMPKILATVAFKAPVMIIRIGWPLLVMRRRARKCSKRMRKELVEGGMPPDLAAGLAENYVSEISVRKLIQQMDIPGLRLRWDDDSP